MRVAVCPRCGWIGPTAARVKVFGIPCCPRCHCEKVTVQTVRSR